MLLMEFLGPILLFEPKLSHILSESLEFHTFDIELYQIFTILIFEAGHGSSPSKQGALSQHLFLGCRASGSGGNKAFP